MMREVVKFSLKSRPTIGLGDAGKADFDGSVSGSVRGRDDAAVFGDALRLLSQLTPEMIGAIRRLAGMYDGS